MICINLIPIRHRQAQNLRARKKNWILINSIYAGILVIAYVVWCGVRAGVHQDLTQQLALLQRDVDDSTKSVSKVRAALRESTVLVRANQAVTGQPDWSILLAMVAELRGDDVVMNRCGLETINKPLTAATPKTSAIILGGETTVFHLEGHGRTQAAVAQFTLRLEHTGLFESVSLLKTSRETYLGGEAMAFKLDCQLKAAPVDSADRTSEQNMAGVIAAEGVLP